MQTVDIVIASYNMGHLIMETLTSCLAQDYPNKRIIVYDDCSTDNTEQILKPLEWITYIRGNINKGVGNAFNTGIAEANGDIIVLMCADDLFTNNFVISDMVSNFDSDPNIALVSRWYYQFVNGYDGPVRAWRGNDPITLANNPSGLAFRRDCLGACSCSNKMFVETTQLVSQVLAKGFKYQVLQYDAIAVRVHRSTSTQAGYWLKHRVSSPVLDQVGLGAKSIATDFVSLIQIKRGFKLSAVIEEIINFIKVKPTNLLRPTFWFWSIVALTIPRRLAICLPEFYRHRIGRLLTKEIKRP